MINAFFLPTQEDVARFQTGQRTENLIRHCFANTAELKAYRDGVDVVEDENDEISGPVVNGCLVQYSHSDDVSDDEEEGAWTEARFATPGEAAAFASGINDAEGWVAPMVIADTDGDGQFEALLSLVREPA